MFTEKMKFETPELEIIQLGENDVIVCSDGLNQAYTTYAIDDEEDDSSLFGN